MPGEFSDINESQAVRESLAPFLIIGSITLRTTFFSIRAARVLISVLYAHHIKRKELQEFAMKYGANLGFLEVGTESTDKLRGLENTFKKYKIEYSRLPDLRKDDGKSQYVFNLEQIDALKNMIQDQAEEKQKRLKDLKEAYKGHPDMYQVAKERLDEWMPGISVISAEDYARTSVKDGKDTCEFLDLETSAEKELEPKTGIKTLSSPEAVQDLFDGLKKKTEKAIEKADGIVREPIQQTISPKILVKRKAR